MEETKKPSENPDAVENQTELSDQQVTNLDADTDCCTPVLSNDTLFFAF